MFPHTRIEDEKHDALQFVLVCKVKHRYISVSYTHLDVYKRQHTHTPLNQLLTYVYSVVTILKLLISGIVKYSAKIIVKISAKLL